MTQSRTMWNTGELQAMYAYIQSQPYLASFPDTVKVQRAQIACLPPTRHRLHVKWNSHASRALQRMQEVSTNFQKPTAQEQMQVPFLSPVVMSAPAISHATAAIPVVIYAKSGAPLQITMAPGVYTLEVL